MRNIKLKIAYDGGAYLGWQKTNEGPSIEGTLELYLKKILRHPVTLQAASRTDAGVHAEEQVVNFITTSQHIDPFKLCISLNQLLPDDIAIISCEEAALTFHPTLQAKGKTYHYYLCTSHFQFSHYRHYSWHCHYALDLGAMQSAAEQLTGHYDFSSFQNKASSRTSDQPIREITGIMIQPLEQQRLRIAIKGHSFLYQMVRNLVGTLAYIGRGKISLKDLPRIIAARDRSFAGPSAPAHGLFLHKVHYDDDENFVKKTHA